MSAYLTHMAIGAAGGVLLARAAPGLLPVAPALATPALAALSALLATWPDLDHPDAWASRRAIPACGVAGAAWSLAVHWPPSTPAALVAAAAWGVGAMCWALVALALLRRLAGGHRGATHGLAAPAILGALGLGLVAAGLASWAWPPAGLVWGWALHLLGDVVTPAGWRPLAPWGGPALRLPRALAVWGEPAAMAVALAVLAGALGLPALGAAVAGVAGAAGVAARRPGRGR